MTRLVKVELTVSENIMRPSAHGWLLCFTPEFRRWLHKNLGKQVNASELITAKHNVWFPQNGYRLKSYGSKFTIITNNTAGAALLKLMRGYVE